MPNNSPTCSFMENVVFFLLLLWTTCTPSSHLLSPPPPILMSRMKGLWMVKNWKVLFLSWGTYSSEKDIGTAISINYPSMSL